MVCVVGIDIGSAYSKGVIMLDDEIGGSYVVPSGGNYELTADRVSKELLSRADQSSKRIVYTIATGYGARSVTFADEVVTDISCHSKGIFYLSPSVRTVVDVGDLFSKAFRIDERGNSLIYGHPQGPTAGRNIAELLEEVVILGGGYGLWAGCAAGDTAAAMVFKIG